jgi:hypothetical protein
MADKDKAEDPGRKDGERRPERYPSVRQDDAVERTGRIGEVLGQGRSFDPSASAPTPRPEAGDANPEAKQEGFEGPQGDPAEGKRD